MIKLCYKEYDYKINLKAMDIFKKATGKDLWYMFILILNTYMKNNKSSVLDLMESIVDVCDFDTAAQLLYAVIKQGETDTPLNEIRDAMFRCGYRPVAEDDSEMRQPYPILLIQLAQAFDAEMAEQIDLKKK